MSSALVACVCCGASCVLVISSTYATEEALSDVRFGRSGACTRSIAMSLHERAPSSPTASYHPDYFEHAYSDQFVTVIPHHVSPSALPPAAHRVSLKQSPQWPSSFDHRDGEDHRLGSEASSPEGTGSLSGSSTGSYSIPRAALDPVQSYPGKTAGSASFTLASHMEEGSGSNGAVTSAEGHSHKDGSGRASWASRPSQLSGGQSLRSVRHDEQSSVTVYAGTKEKFSYSKEPNAVLALVSSRFVHESVNSRLLC